MYVETTSHAKYSIRHSVDTQISCYKQAGEKNR
jgi:hypothetical protein